MFAGHTEKWEQHRLPQQDSQLSDGGGSGGPHPACKRLSVSAAGRRSRLAHGGWLSGLHCFWRFLPFLPAQKLVSGFLQGGGRSGDLCISDLFVCVEYVLFLQNFHLREVARTGCGIMCTVLRFANGSGFAVFALSSSHVLSFYTRARARAFFPRLFANRLEAQCVCVRTGMFSYNHGCTLSTIRRLSADPVLTRVHRTDSDFIRCPSDVLHSRRWP